MKKNDSNLFYTCSLIELIGRTTRQKRKDVVNLMGEKIIRHIYHHADTLHCEPIAKIADYYIDFCHIPTGEFDNIASCKYSVPSYWEIGKVYARLIEDIQKDDVIFALIRVYNSTVSDSISYYNSDFFYQPRGFIKEQFLSEENAVSGETSKKPAIRFRGFTDAWEQRKVGELIEDFTERTTVENQYPVLTSSQKQGIVLQEQYFADRQVTTDNNVGYFVLPKGFFTYRSRSDSDVFVFNRNDLIDKGIISIYYPVFRAQNVDSDFLLRRLNHGMRRQLIMAAEGTGQKVLAHGKFKNMIVLIPDYTEQQKIGALFRDLDRLITLHQRKHEKMVSIKKAMLEKLFPQNGTNFPEIRFSGFTDAWEQREFSEITYPAGEKNRDNHPYESFSITNEDGFVPQNEKFENGGTMRDADKRMYFIVSPNSFAYNPARINVGSIGYQNLHKNVIVSSLYEVFKTTSDVDDRFLWHWFKSENFQRLIEHLQEGGVRLYFYYDKLCQGHLPLPTIEEQQEIGRYFDHLDHLITLHQRELEKLRNIKKACLEKMFV